MFYLPTPPLRYYHTQYLHNELQPHRQHHPQIPPQNYHSSLIQPHYHYHHNNYHTITHQCTFSNRTCLSFVATWLDPEENFPLAQNRLHPELHPIPPKI